MIIYSNDFLSFFQLIIYSNDHLPSFDNFSVLAHENTKYLLEIEESLLIMRDKPSLNRNLNSACTFAPTWSSVLSFSLFQISTFNLVSLSPSKYHYKIAKKKLFISIKHVLIIGRDMPETSHQKILTKNLD